MILDHPGLYMPACSEWESTLLMEDDNGLPNTTEAIIIYFNGFIPLCCDISLLHNMLPSNISTLHCLYQSCYMFQSLRTIIRYINTYLKHTFMYKLNIITLQAHKYYYLAIILYFFSISLFIVILILFSMVCHILPQSLPASKSMWYNSWFNFTLFI